MSILLYLLLICSIFQFHTNKNLAFGQITYVEDWQKGKRAQDAMAHDLPLLEQAASPKSDKSSNAKRRPPIINSLLNLNNGVRLQLPAGLTSLSRAWLANRMTSADGDKQTLMSRNIPFIVLVNS